MALYRLIQLLLLRSCKNIHLLHNHSNTINQSTIIYLSSKRKYIPIGTNTTFSYLSAEKVVTRRDGQTELKRNWNRLKNIKIVQSTERHMTDILKDRQTNRHINSRQIDLKTDRQTKLKLYRYTVTYRNTDKQIDLNTDLQQKSVKTRTTYRKICRQIGNTAIDRYRER